VRVWFGALAHGARRRLPGGEHLDIASEGENDAGGGDDEGVGAASDGLDNAVAAELFLAKRNHLPQTAPVRPFADAELARALLAPCPDRAVLC
jgi:hypothetical protein